MSRQSGYLSEDTIAAISTAIGGALTIVRITGSEAMSCLLKITRGKKGLGAEKARKMNRSNLYLENGAILDQCLFVYFLTPNSFTGEDLVEFHLHGGGWIAHRLMDELIHCGLRQALPGEFSFRAVRNGKMNLFQAEAVADLICASNESAAQLAIEKMSDTQNHLLTELGSQLKTLAALGELSIDFSDQDLEELSSASLQKHCHSVTAILTKLRDSYQRGIRLQDGISVALVGLPNAGKSSLFNSILGENRSIVSPYAGTTRDSIREKFILKCPSGPGGPSSNVTLQLEDTAGLHSTDHPIEKIGIERTLAAFKKADLVLIIVDPTQPLQQAFEQVAQLNPEASHAKDCTPKQLLGIVTKADTLPSTQECVQQATHLFGSLGVFPWIVTSAKNGEGIQQAAEAIFQATQKIVHRDPGELLLTRLDHLKATELALEHLMRAMATASQLDLFAADIRQALHALAPLLGEIPPEDILTKIFSDFCIGK